MSRIGDGRAAGIKLARRGARWQARRWWSDARPSTGMDLTQRPAGDARAVLGAGGTPGASDRFVPLSAPSGPWHDVDPHVAPSWPRLTASFAVAVWAAGVAFATHRRWRAPGA